LARSHFHIDHAAALPYFTEKLPGFRGKIFATHSTVAVLRILLGDFVRVSNVDSDSNLYGEDDIAKCLSRIELVDFKQVRC
jgi:cleavage and polyadenylation specificity factor subunit 3